jgi:hypothetical protein
MPYIGNVLTSFAVETGNINDQAVTAPKLSATGGTDGQVLALDSNLNLEWVSDPAGQWVTSGSNIYYNDGNVGIGTSSPSNLLHLNGTSDQLRISDGSNGFDIRAGGNFIIEDDGTERLRIDSSGRVGIGTTNPGSLLHLSGNSPRLTLTDTDTGVDHRLNADSSIGNLAFDVDYNSEATSPSVVFNLKGSEKLRIDSSGNVGIGTSSPTNQLHIYDGTAANDRAELKIESFRPGIRFQDRSSSSSSAEIVGDNALLFRVSAPVDDDTALTERMRINSSGNVGVGTSSPDQKLHIVGNYKGVNSSGQGVQIVNVATPYIQSLGTSTINDLMVSSKTFRVETGTSYATSERLRIDSSGNVGIGTSSPDALLNLESTTSASLRIKNTTNNTPSVPHIELLNNNNEGLDITINRSGSDSRAKFVVDTAISVDTNGSERLRIDSSGRLLVGTSSARTKFQISTGFGNVTPVHQFEFSSQTYNGLSITHNAGANGYPAVLAFGKSRGTSAGSYTTVTNGDGLGWLDFYGADGTNMVRAASIRGEVDGTPGSADMPGRLLFYTTADGAGQPTERMRIDSSGMVELRANQGTAETNIIRFTDTDTSVAASQKFGQLQWFSNDASGGGPSVKGEIYVVARDTTPDGDMVFATHDGGGTNTAENIRLISEGGLTFNGDTAVANALNDYEEGTWTPTIDFGGSFNGTYSTNEGFYTKIGRLVNVSCELALSSKGSTTGQVNISGLPFTTNSDDESRASGVFGYYQDVSGIDFPIVILLENNATSFPLRDSASASATGITNSNLGNGFRCYFTITYMT